MSKTSELKKRKMNSNRAKKNHSAIGNISVSMIAQLVSLAVSFVLGIIVPKFITELDYANWQTYVMYIGFVGILHFGIVDGIVLRYSQYDYDQLDHSLIRSQLRIMLVYISAFAALLAVFAIIFLSGVAQILAILLSVGLVIKNYFWFSSSIFQTTLRIKKYAVMVILQRLAQCAVVIALLLSGVDNFVWYCLSEIIGDIVSGIMATVYNKEIVFGKPIKMHDALLEARKNISSGFKLLFANWTAVFILGSAKLAVQLGWDQLVFGKVSFAFSLVNLFLMFVSAVSIVLFPTLKRTEIKELPDLYKRIRSAMTPILFFAMIAYFPFCWILNLWLPAYASSFEFLGILLPIIVFSSRVNLLANNYLKAYRKEKTLLLINLFSLVFGVIIFGIAAYFIKDLMILLYCGILVIAINSFFLELAVSKIINRKFLLSYLVEFILIAGFVLATRAFSLPIGLAVYAGLFTVYMALAGKKFFRAIKRSSNAELSRGNSDSVPDKRDD